MNIDRYFEYKLNHIAAGIGILVIWGLVWCVIKLFNLAATVLPTFLTVS